MRISEVHRTQISKYERGETEPQIEALAKLSRALDVSTEDFFAGVDWQKDPPRLVIRSVDPDTAK
jgi:transcriptional regulator with XRE-family HTH domain